MNVNFNTLLDFFVIFLLQSHLALSSPDDERAGQWLQKVNIELTKLSADLAQARWNYEANIAPETSKIQLEADAAYDSFQRSIVPELMKFDPRRIQDFAIRRQLDKMQRYAVNGAIWTEANSARERFLVNAMTTVFNTRSICALANDGTCSSRWSFDPDILRFFAISRNYDALTFVWTAWREAVGPAIRPHFVEEINLVNAKARAMKFPDWGAVWRSLYEMDDFEGEARRLYHEILPLYEQLHAYVRRRFKQDVYRNKFLGPAIPAHIFGNVMGEEWSNIYSFTSPYPNKGNIDVSGAMRRQGYDERKIFQVADDFYSSMGLISAPASFWQRSIFSQIPNRAMVCHATSWDMYKEWDVRVRMCARISQLDLLVAHHEMGHIQYFLQYADQPITFREPANPGFHESIGDTIALSASSKRHLRTIGLLDDDQNDFEGDINFLYRQALLKIPFLMFSYLVDVWRWRLFDGTYNSGNLNKSWWENVFEFMGLIPPVSRNESHFDAAAKSHIVDGTEFARYFIAGILQFQFYQSMCKAAGQSGPLHQCDFYGSKEAGNKLAEMLRLGGSRHWTVSMQAMTGDARMSAKPLLNYFKPLHEWLINENARAQECYGWGQAWSDDVMNTLSSPRCA